jgi:hypothetical protein
MEVRSHHAKSGARRVGPCSKYCAKRDCIKEQLTRKPVFNLVRADDPDFPADFDERIGRMSMQRGIVQFQKSIAKFPARANLSARQEGGEALDGFVRDIASIAVRLVRS